MGNKETVIIVHGTWAAPGGDAPCWYEPPAAGAKNFASKLDDALQQRGSPARCWAHCRDGGPSFNWSGGNTWIERATASRALASYVNDLQSAGWTCHIVAHSHGGNVVAEALPSIGRKKGGTGFDGTVTTLGTPYIDTLSPISRLIDRRLRFADWVAWFFYLAILLMAMYVAAMAFSINLPDPSQQNEEDRKILVAFRAAAAFLLVALLAMGALSFFRSRGGSGWGQYWTLLGKDTTHPPFILAIGSTFDEAWQLLHHVRSIGNPLLVDRNVVRYLYRAHKEYIRRSRELHRINGASVWSDLSWWSRSASVAFIALFVAGGLAIPYFYLVYAPTLGVNVAVMSATDHLVTLFAGGVGFFTWFALVSVGTFLWGRSLYSAVWSPIRWLSTQLRAFGALPQELATYIVRWRGWFTLQQLALGLEGYRFALPEVGRQPSYMPQAIFRYEDLPSDVEARALERRSEWLTRHFGDVSQTFSQIAVSAADISELLRLIANDLSLVHAAYYTDDQCIARVSDWIAQRTDRSGGKG